MDLKDFVSETLAQIVLGVKAAPRTLVAKEGAVIKSLSYGGWLAISI